MTLRKPTICKQTTTENEVTLSLLIPAELSDFKGHFPLFPILPGVTQIDWVLFYGKSLLNCPAIFKGMEVIKFQEPILPNMHVDLKLRWDAEKQKLYFNYSSEYNEQTKQHASGRIKLGDF